MVRAALWSCEQYLGALLAVAFGQEDPATSVGAAEHGDDEDANDQESGQAEEAGRAEAPMRELHLHSLEDAGLTLENVRQVFLFEGGSVSYAEGNGVGVVYAIANEGTLLDLLDEEDAAGFTPYSVFEFATAEARERYAARRWSRFERMEEQVRRPSPHAPSWRAFERALTEVLRVLGPEQFLIVSRSESGFVQFAGGEGELRAEATGPAYLLADERRKDRKLLALVRDGLPALGWELPDPEQNYVLPLEAPVDHAYVAKQAVRALRRIFGAKGTGEPIYTAFDNETGTMRFGELGIMAGE